jgi:hypothetical protein
MSTITITYRKNPLYSERESPQEPRLFAELDLRGFGVDAKVENLAIYYRSLKKPVGAIRVVYTTYIAGLPLETGNLQRLKEVINETLRVLVRFERLPEYMFQVKENAWPIYHPPGMLLTSYPGGPVFSTSDIASLRVWLANHFKSLGRIQHRREMGLLYLSPFDLQLYRPQCVVRIPGEENPDIPVFPDPNAGNLRLIAPVNSISLTKPFDSGKGILSIHKAVEDYLLERNQLTKSHQTTVRKLALKDWESLQKQLTPYSEKLTFLRDMGEGEKQFTLPVYNDDETFITGRTNRLGGVVLFFSSSPDSLRQSVGEDLSSYGAIKSPEEVLCVPA